MLDKYIVLRDRARTLAKDRSLVDSGEEFLGSVDLLRRLPESPHRRLPEMISRIETEIVEIDRAGVRHFQKDPATVAIARAIPMKLIAPMDAAGSTFRATSTAAWGVEAVGVQQSPFTGEGIVVAVLDTGIDALHPAFSGVELICRDFTSEGDEDSVGHGTHCAGIIFGRSIDGMRVGIATGVKKALIAKVLGTAGGGLSTNVANAIQWAVSNGAHVISMSLSIDFPGMVELLRNDLPPELATSRALELYRQNVLLFERLAALVRAQGAFEQHPTIIVSAAGNESRRDRDPRYVIAVGPPAVAEGIISVAALDQGPKGLRIAPFSNAGANVSGPGVDIVSARVGGGLAARSGTSMAAPHVAGVAALWAEKLLRAGELTGFQLTSRLNGSATSEGLEPGFDPGDVGLGLIRAPT